MIKKILSEANASNFKEKVGIYNAITQELYDWLGLNHPSLNVQLAKADEIEANDYNPNKVAPPEMRLLKLSIQKDGLTMPVVVAEQKSKKHPFVVVDGFHRTTVTKNNKDIIDSLHGYIPVSKLNKSIEDRISATVRHNIARGTHQVELSAKLVVLLKKHNWTNARIGKELGMDADEVLRLKQITGLAEAFADKEFSKSWE
jgi:ParB-like chromosome segregation protein Spo0J